MPQPISNAQRGAAHVQVDKSDLVAAWCLLEGLAVSFDQIGGAMPDAARRRAVLADYVTPELLRQINEARMRLGRYLPDEEAEALSETTVKYWDYEDIEDAK